MSKASTWAITIGCLLMVAGLGFLPAAFGEHSDPSLLGAGISLFAFGALVAAGGLYLKARALQSLAPAAVKPQPKRTRGGCDLCTVEIPVINCRVHQLHMCGDCLREHYDQRSCAYVPSTRKAAPARFAAKA